MKNFKHKSREYSTVNTYVQSMNFNNHQSMLSLYYQYCLALSSTLLAYLKADPRYTFSKPIFHCDCEMIEYYFKIQSHNETFTPNKTNNF